MGHEPRKYREIRSGQQPFLARLPIEISVSPSTAVINYRVKQQRGDVGSAKGTGTKSNNDGHPLSSQERDRDVRDIPQPLFARDRIPLSVKPNPAVDSQTGLRKEYKFQLRMIIPHILRSRRVFKFRPHPLAERSSIPSSLRWPISAADDSMRWGGISCTKIRLFEPMSSLTSEGECLKLWPTSCLNECLY